MQAIPYISGGNPVTAIHCTATEMINTDTTLNNNKKHHIIQCFIDNVAYAEVYVVMLDKPSLKKKCYTNMLKDGDIDDDEEEDMNSDSDN